MGNINSLVKIAITIAIDDHENGKFAVAHDMLFETY